MRALALVFILFSLSSSSQYTYWTYNGEGVNPFGYVISIKGFLEDSTFRMIGARFEDGQRAYEAVHSSTSGVLVSSKSSDYRDFAFLGASGYSPSSFFKLPDNGYLIVRSVLVNGYGYPKYLRFDANLDTVWVREPVTFEDPFGPSFQNGPLFMTPLENGRYFSLTSTRVTNSGRYLRFLQHDVETGDIVADHLWDVDEVNFDGSIYGTSLFNGVQFAPDSLLAWGNYSRYVLSDDPLQTFIANFDLEGNLGHYRLMDIDAAVPSKDLEAVGLLQDGVFNYFFPNGVGISPESSSVGFPLEVELRVQRFDPSTLEVLEDIHIPFPPVDNLWLYSAGFSQVIATDDGGYLGNFIVIDESIDGNSDTYLIKLNENMELEWYRPLLLDIHRWTSTVLLEDSDRSIIVGGGVVETIIGSTQYDYFIKLDACGYMVPSDCPEFVSVADGEIRREGFRLWPNPGTGAVDAIVPFNARQLQVVDASGRCVYTEDLYYPRQTWQLTHLPNGVYTFIVHTEDGRKHHQRWVKR